VIANSRSLLSFILHHNGKHPDEIYSVHPIHCFGLFAHPRTVHDDFGGPIETMGRWAVDPDHDSQIPDWKGTYLGLGKGRSFVSTPTNDELL
jgi:hypothetical protein